MGTSWVRYPFFLYILLLLTSIESHAQVAIQFTQPGLGEMEVCADSATFSFTIGPFSSNLTGVEIRVQLPTGIYYVQNSLANLPGADVNLSLNSYSGQTIVFQGNSIASGHSYDFSLNLFAGCDALPDFQSGQAFRNTIEVYENSNLYEQTASPLYNPAIDYGQLSMSTGASPTGVVGQTVTRDIEIFSTGSGCIKLLSWYDTYGPDAKVDSIYFQGQKLNSWTNGDTIFYNFTGTDFSQLGDGNGKFCQSDGSLVLTEYIQILGCVDKSSYISAGWGCNGLFCSDFNLSADVVVNNLQPSLQFFPRPDTLSGCFYNQPNRKELVIKNVGAGSVANVEVEIKKNYYAGQFTENKYDGLDSNSVEIRFNDGVFTPISPRNVESNIYGNACSLPLAYRFYVDVDFLTPGDSITIAFDMINCIPDECGETEIRQGSWGYNCRYELPCIGSSAVIANQVGGFPGILEHQISNFDPPTLVSGKEVSFTTTMERSEIDFPPGGAFLVKYTLPTCGASFSGTSDDFQWMNIGGDLSWPSYDFMSSATEVEAKFDLDSIPSNFTVNGSEIKLNLLGDCSCPPTDSIQQIEKRIFYLPTPNCSPQAQIPIFCDTLNIIVDPCLVTTCNGMQIIDFGFQRSNLDLPDADLNRIPDGGTTHSTEVRQNRARLGDTIQAQLTGYVNGAGSFTYGYADMTVGFAQYLSPLAGEVRMYDLSSGNSFTCSDALPVRVGGTDIFRIDYSPSSLSGSCGAFGGLNLEMGDSIFLDLRFVVSSVHPQNLEVGAIFPIEMYMSNVPNPTEADKFTCQGTKFSELMQLVPMVDTSFVTQISAQSCQQTQARTYINMFTGGSYTDMFPFEYRAWSFPDTLLVTPPADYNYVSANILLRFSPYIAVMNVSPVDPHANPLVFDLKALVDNGSLLYPDDGYELQFFTTWLPECDAVSNQQVQVPVEGRFRWAPGLAAYDVPKNYLPTIRHNTPSISLNNQSAATQDGLTREVSWDMQVSNTSINSNSPYTWMAFSSPSGEIQVVSLLDNNGNPVTHTNGIYELGLLNTSSNKDYQIQAEYDQCSLDTLIVYTGWECAGYPASLSVACQTDSFYLRIDPKPADGQISLNTSVMDTVALFEPISYDLAIRSTQIANIEDLVLEIFHANSGLDFIAGSAELEYPLGSGFQAVPDPVAIAGGYRFTLANYDSTLSRIGLAGLSSSSAADRQFNLRFDLAPNCNFTSGETFLIKLLAAMPCGDPLNIQRIMEPIYIDGGLSPYQTAISAKLEQVYSCNDYGVKISLIPNDSTGTSDSVEVLFPTGFSYDSSVYRHIHNALPSTQPRIEAGVNGNWHKWPLDSGIAGGDSLVFLIGLTRDLGTQCPAGDTIPLQIRSSYQYPGNCQTGNGAFLGLTGIDSFQLGVFDNFSPQIDLAYSGANPRTVSQDSQQWILVLSHTRGNFSAAFPWVRFISSSGNSTPISLKNHISGIPFQSGNGFWQIDSIHPGGSISLALDAQVSFCGPDTLMLLYGYACDDYPLDPSAIPCTHDTLRLIVNPSFPYIDLSIQDSEEPTCYRGNNGRVVLSASGGPAPYEYAMDTLVFGNSSQFNSLLAGSYTFYARDSIGCIDSLDFVINQPPPLVLSVDSITNILCSGDSTGQIQVSGSGGVAPYSFTLDDGNFGTLGSFTNLPAGIYMVRIKDSQNCEDSTKVSLLESAPLLSLMQIDAPISCYGAHDGAISVSSAGGNGNLQYVWQGFPDTDSNLLNLSPGNFIVTISDQAGCNTTDSIRLSEPPQIFSNLTLLSDLTCRNSSDAVVEAMVSGGSSGFTYTWSAGLGNGNQVTQVPSGKLILEVSDSRACIKRDSIRITAPPFLKLTITGTEVSCGGGNDGSVTVLAVGGIFPYTYEWNNTPALSSASLSNQAAGLYEVIVTDDNNCQDTISYEITEPSVLTLNLGAFDETCSSANGSVWAEVSGGSPPYEYLWNNDPALNADSLFNLSAGTYSLVLRDNNSCQESSSYTLTNQEAPLIERVSSQDASCKGLSDGSAEVRVNGNRSYTYSWVHSGETTPAVNNLSAGTYTVMASDGTCQGSLEVIISEPDQLSVNEDSLILPSCPAEADGEMYVSSSGGTAPYTYQWVQNGAANTAFLTSLSSGTYEVHVQDLNNCRDTIETFLPDPIPLSLVLETEDVLCEGTQTGTAKAIVQGGESPYDISWSNGASGDSIGDLAIGNYSLFIRDAQGCELDSSFTLTEPPVLELSLSKTDILCYKGNSGEAQVLVSGGIPPYQYTWSTQENSPNIQGLLAGTYSVLVRDGNNCTAIDSVEIAQGDSIHIELVSQRAAYCGLPNGSAQVLATGGSGALNFRWNSSPAQTGPIATNLYGVDQGISYSVKVSDEFGCTDSLAVNIESLPRPKADFLSIPNLRQPILRSEAEIKFINKSQNSEGYFWDFGVDNAYSNETHPTYTYEKAGTYRVGLIAIDLPPDCPDTMYMDIVVIEDGKIFTANAFSPNDDGNNDIFYAYGEGIQSFEMLIFDRFGNLIKRCSQIGEGWDGTGSDGRRAPEGVYTYAIKALLNDGTRLDRGGSITLFR